MWSGLQTLTFTSVCVFLNVLGTDLYEKIDSVDELQAHFVNDLGSKVEKPFF